MAQELSFKDVTQWVVMQASAEDRNLLRNLLLTIDRTGIFQPPGQPPAVMREVRDENTYSTLVVDTEPKAKRLKPGHYKMRVAKVSVTGTRRKWEAADEYKPQSPFSKSWWSKLRRASVPMSAKGLAALVKKPSRAKEISTTLGTLYNRGLIDRSPEPGGGPAFLYFTKKGA